MSEAQQAWIAQSVERTTLNRVVVGSIPTLGAIVSFTFVVFFETKQMSSNRLTERNDARTNTYSRPKNFQRQKTNC